MVAQNKLVQQHLENKKKELMSMMQNSNGNVQQVLQYEEQKINNEIYNKSKENATISIKMLAETIKEIEI